jgi:hypothetical protein
MLQEQKDSDGDHLLYRIDHAKVRKDKLQRKITEYFAYSDGEDYDPPFEWKSARPGWH